MVVMHFLKTGNYSGAENVAITIMENMKMMHEVDSVYVSVHGDIDKVLSKKQLKHFAISKPSQKEFQRAVDAVKPNIIHAHDFSSSIIAANLNTDAVIISHLHNNPPWLRNRGIRSRVYIKSAKKFEHIFLVSDSIIKEYVYGERIRKKSVIIKNPVDIRTVRTLSQSTTDTCCSDMIFVGRLSVQKNPLLFIDIVEQCKKIKSNFKTYMIGKGELEQECKEKIKQLNLEKNIVLTGFVENPYGYLKNTKVLCLPSKWEGFGLVVVEAFALGVPVVASPVGGMKDLVTESAGKLCCTIDDFKDEIIRLVTDVGYHAMKSKESYNRAAELDNLEYYIDSMYGYYRKCVQVK